jgi:hypothetical protein
MPTFKLFPLTFTIWHDASAGRGQNGYCAHHDIRPGARASEGDESLSALAETCASGPRPPRAVLNAARRYLDIGVGPSRLDFTRLEDVRITAGCGWVVDRRDDVEMVDGAVYGEGEERVVLHVTGGIPYLDDEGGGEYRLTPDGYRLVYWSRDPVATLLDLARNGGRNRAFGEWRT